MLFPIPLILLMTPVLANVEKTIFKGPAGLTIPYHPPNIEDLYLIPVSPLHPSVRTYINATFPTTEASKGTETWMLLDGLVPDARYEVRICWLATQPTAFSLHTFTLTEVFEKPELLSSLSTFAYARQAELGDLEVQKLLARRSRPSTVSGTREESLLFLKIYAAADYFSLNKALMETVPPVLADIILDQYLLNVFPKSLLPTAGYLVVLALGSWYLSGFISRGLLWVAEVGQDQALGSEVSAPIKKDL